jgi:predicted ribosomally synthesized peptide with nif11-like leader
VLLSIWKSKFLSKGKVVILMSIESAKAFIAKVHTDKDFAVSLANLKTQEETKAFEIKAGYDFSQEEFNEAVSILSDDELDTVTGGYDFVYNGMKVVTNPNPPPTYLLTTA